MVTAEFNRHDDEIVSVIISGHADYSTEIMDVVCAEVSAIGVGTLNAIDTLCPNCCHLEMSSGYICIKVNHSSEELQIILKILEIQLLTVEHTNKNYVTVRKVEV